MIVAADLLDASGDAARRGEPRSPALKPHLVFRVVRHGHKRGADETDVDT